MRLPTLTSLGCSFVSVLENKVSTLVSVQNIYTPKNIPEKIASMVCNMKERSIFIETK